jgi:hypothetical protein
MARRVYAYGVMVCGRKRYGGTVHADSMDDAAKRAATRCKLTIDKQEPSYRPCDGEIVKHAQWLLDGKKASLLVWAPPEYF